MKECINCSNINIPIVLSFKPRNAARISEKRKEFMEACGEASNQNFQQRYHAEEVEERFGKFKPGVIRYLFFLLVVALPFCNTFSTFGVPDLSYQSSVKHLLLLIAGVLCLNLFAKENFSKSHNYFPDESSLLAS